MLDVLLELWHLLLVLLYPHNKCASSVVSTGGLLTHHRSAYGGQTYYESRAGKKGIRA
jgi:hypothetical protein